MREFRSTARIPELSMQEDCFPERTSITNSAPSPKCWPVQLVDSKRDKPRKAMPFLGAVRRPRGRIPPCRQQTTRVPTVQRRKGLANALVLCARQGLVRGKGRLESFSVVAGFRHGKCAGNKPAGKDVEPTILVQSPTLECRRNGGRSITRIHRPG